MGVWRYCHKCDAGQSRMSLEDFRFTDKVLCHSCGAERQDDTWQERFDILLEEFLELKEEVKNASK